GGWLAADQRGQAAGLVASQWGHFSCFAQYFLPRTADGERLAGKEALLTAGISSPHEHEHVGKRAWHEYVGEVARPRSPVRPRTTSSGRSRPRHRCPLLHRLRVRLPAG